MLARGGGQKARKFCRRRMSMVPSTQFQPRSSFPLPEFCRLSADFAALASSRSTNLDGTKPYPSADTRLSWGHITSVVRGIQRNLEPISVDMRCVLDMTSASKQPRCSTHAYVHRLQAADINISALTHIWPAPVPPLYCVFFICFLISLLPFVFATSPPHDSSHLHKAAARTCNQSHVASPKKADG